MRLGSIVRHALTTTGEFDIARPDQNRPAPPKDDGPRVNHQIDAKTVRLIDFDGANLGVVDRDIAIKKADDAGYDLVEISPGASPPVCKILDLGKYKYEIQKKENEAKKKQKVIEVKELKVRPAIGVHDYEVKMRALKSAEHAATRSCVASSPTRVTSSWCSLSTCTAYIAVVRHRWMRCSCRTLFAGG